MQQEPPVTNRNIPFPIQREVRQRCGFGCVICGMPLYEYEHMEGWAQAKRHIAEEITLLCDQHHRERTAGLLPLSAVRDANRDPYNLKTGVSNPYALHFSGKRAEVMIGSNLFTCEDRGYGTFMIPISVDDTPLIGFILGDGHVLLNLNIFDECNQLVLQIVNNALILFPEPWDIQLVGTRLTIREAKRKILIEINFQPPNRVVIERGRFLRNGVEVLVRPENILLTNNSSFISGCQCHGANGGLIVGPHSMPLRGFLRLDGIRRYLGDRTEALKFEKECMEPMGEPM